MKVKESTSEARRQLTKFLALSPLLLYTNNPLKELLAEDQDPVITKAADAINVLDFRKAAQQKLSTAHFGYIETGVLDDRTLLENEKAFSRIKLRMRRLLDMTDVDPSIELFGEQWSSPIYISPCGSQKAFHQEGELATARAARSQNTLQMLSTMSTNSIEDVVAAKGSPVWFQLYPSEDWEDTLAMIERATKAGSKSIVLTIDSDYPDGRETLWRAMDQDANNCQTCHGQRTRANWLRNKPIINNLQETYRVKSVLTWEYVKKLREATDLKLVLKGIVSGDDGCMALDHGVDGIIVSNHGGRATDSGRASLDSLTEVAKALDGQLPLMMDGGVRRGKDVLKAIAYGASMVGIGRPYLWGLSAFGQEGVETVLKLLNAELVLAMQQTGAKSLAEIDQSMLV